MILINKITSLDVYTTKAEYDKHLEKSFTSFSPRFDCSRAWTQLTKAKT